MRRAPPDGREDTVPFTTAGLGYVLNCSFSTEIRTASNKKRFYSPALFFGEKSYGVNVSRRAGGLGGATTGV
jgi:hypothetical protein